MLLVCVLCWRVEGWRGTVRAGRRSYHLASPRAHCCPHHSSECTGQQEGTWVYIYGCSEEQLVRTIRIRILQATKWPISDTFIEGLYSPCPAVPWLDLPSPPNILAVVGGIFLDPGLRQKCIFWHVTISWHILWCSSSTRNTIWIQHPWVWVSVGFENDQDCQDDQVRWHDEGSFADDWLYGIFPFLKHCLHQVSQKIKIG